MNFTHFLLDLIFPEPDSKDIFLSLEIRQCLGNCNKTCLQHLKISPGTFMLEQDQYWLKEFGIFFCKLYCVYGPKVSATGKHRHAATTIEEDNAYEIV